MPVTKTCVICGKEFQAPFHWKYTRNTCSKQCRYQLTSKQLKGKVFPHVPYPDHHRTPITIHPETRTCAQCGLEFVVNPSSTKKLCSLRCKIIWCANLMRGSNNPNWKETKTLRPSNKKSLRHHIRARDKVCQDCGSNKSLQVHHVDSDPQNNSESNLVLLCKICHAARHQNMGESNLVGLIMVNRTYRHTPNRDCIICGKNFAPHHSGDKCCSTRCAQVQAGLSRRKPNKP